VVPLPGKRPELLATKTLRNDPNGATRQLGNLWRRSMAAAAKGGVRV